MCDKIVASFFAVAYAIIAQFKMGVGPIVDLALAFKQLLTQTFIAQVALIWV